MFMLNQLIGFGQGSQELIWANAFGPVTLDTNSGSWTGYNTRNPIALIRNGDYVRVTFNAATDSTLVISNAWIGRKAASGDPYDFLAGTPTELKFNNGSSGFSIAAGGSIVSDPLFFPIDATLDYIISMFVTSGNQRYLTSSLYTLYYKFTSNETSTPDVTSYTTQGSRQQTISRVEVAGGAPTFAFWNQNDKTSTNVTLSNNNRTATMGSAGGHSGVRATKGITSLEKCYWEVKATAWSVGVFMGLVKATASLGLYVGGDTLGWGKYSNDGDVYNNGGVVFNGAPYAVNDVMMFAFDGPGGKFFVGKNGTWENSGDPAAGTGALITGLTSGPYYPMISDSSSGADTCTMTGSFSSATYVHTMPAGYSELII